MNRTVDECKHINVLINFSSLFRSVRGIIFECIQQIVYDVVIDVTKLVKLTRIARVYIIRTSFPGFSK